jgi:hypothetical protein
VPGEGLSSGNIYDHKRFFNPLDDIHIDEFRYPTYLSHDLNLDEGFCMNFEKITEEEQENLYLVRSFYFVTRNIEKRLINSEKQKVDFTAVS